MTRFLSACSLMLLLAISLPAPGAEGLPTREQLTNKLRFRIPFQFDADEQVRAVELLESRDRGKTWKSVQTVDPSAGKFQFQAPASGVYWFSVRTIDRNGKKQPASGDVKPGLKVLVDAEPPLVKLQVTQPSPGTVHVAWDLRDERLELSTFRLRYRMSGSREWIEPSIVPQARHHYDFKITQPGLVTVMLEVADEAKNTTQQEQSLQAVGPSDSAPPRRSEKVAEGIRGKGIADALSMATEFPDSQQRVAAEREPSKLAGKMRPLPGGSQAQRSMATSHSGGLPQRTAGEQSEPRVKSTRQLVNSLRFEVRYTLHDVTPEELDAVELYLTSDGGATWQHAGNDEDLRSPFLVDVAEPGEYGLQLVVRDRSGNGGPVPADGDSPGMTVIVDQKAPELELLRIERVDATPNSPVEIAWRCTDEYLDDAPISLLYSDRQGGKWIRIEQRLPNTGEYTWQPGTPLPPVLFLRIEARDGARNLRVVETPRGVRLEARQSTAQGPEAGEPASQ